MKGAGFKTCSLADIYGYHRIIIILLLATLAGFGPLCTDMYLPALPSISKDLSISTASVQSSITSCLLGLALGQLIIGPLSDGQGRKKLLLASLFLFIISSLLCSMATSGKSFIALRFLQGLAGSGGAVLCRALSCDSFRGSELTRFISLFMGITGIAPVLGPLIGGSITEFFSWHGIFYLLSLIGAVLFIGCWAAMPETLAPEKRIQGGMISSFGNMKTLFGQKAFLCYMAVQGFTSAGFFCYISASPFVFMNIYAFNVEEFSFLFGSNAMILVGASFIVGMLSKRFGDKNLLLFGNIFRAVFSIAVLAVALIQPASPIPMIITIMGMLAMQGFIKPTSFSLAIVSQTTGAGTASGVLGVVFFICGAAASPLAGLAGPGSALPLGIISAISGIFALAFTFMGNRAFDKLSHRGVYDIFLEYKKTKKAI